LLNNRLAERESFQQSGNSSSLSLRLWRDRNIGQCFGHSEAYTEPRKAPGKLFIEQTFGVGLPLLQLEKVEQNESC
jgi:hypothetical protein